MGTKRRIPWGMAGAALLFLVLALLFVPECDDCYFAYWQFDSLRDFLLVRPIPEEGVVLGVPANGRYLGNLLGLVLGKLAFSDLWWLRPLILAGGLLALTLLLARFLPEGTVDRREAFLGALALVLFAPWGIWQQVYSWAAAYANYLVPGLVILAILLLLERNRPGGWPLVAVLALTGGLFTEQNTLYLVLLGTLLAAAGCIPRFRAGLPRLSLRLALLAGSWAGLAVSMTNSVLAQVDSGVRKLSLELVRDNLPILFTEVLLRPVPLCLCISALLLYVARKQGNRWWKLWACLLIPLHLCILRDRFLVVFRGRAMYREENLLLGAVLAGLWLILVLQQRGSGRLWLYIVSLLVVTGPMVVVYPVNARMFFSSWLFLCLTAMDLYGRARTLGLRPVTWLRWAAAGAGVALVLVYFCNARLYVRRLDYARRQVEAGAVQVTLPLVPFPQFTVNEAPGKGDIAYLVYREAPWDVAFTFRPYRDYLDTNGHLDAEGR